MAEPLLEVTDLRAGYGPVPVLHGLSLSVMAGETVVLLGLNGAGKTTTALTLCGHLAPTGGSIRFQGEPLSGLTVRRAVRRGIVLVPEGRHVFPALSVEKNLELGAWTKRRGVGGAARRWVHERSEQVYEYFPRLRERHDQLAGTLSGGEQQMLAIGRGLMADPKILIIDEASLGLAPVIVENVFRIVRRINEQGVTVILVEQNVGALAVADVGLVMEQGRVVTEVRGEDLRDVARVRKVFLG